MGYNAAKKLTKQLKKRPTVSGLVVGFCIFFVIFLSQAAQQQLDLKLFEVKIDYNQIERNFLSRLSVFMLLPCFNCDSGFSAESIYSLTN